MIGDSPSRRMLPSAMLNLRRRTMILIISLIFGVALYSASCQEEEEATTEPTPKLIGTQLGARSEWLTLVSKILIALGVVGFAFTPLIEGKMLTLREVIADNQIKYAHIRRSVDAATAIWELSRAFFAYKDILDALNVPDKARSRNSSDYRYCIVAAENFAFNAAYGNVTTEQEKRLGQQQHNVREQPENKTVDAVRERYNEYLLKATERGSKTILETRQLESKSAALLRVKTWIHAVALMLTTIGLTIEISCIVM